MSRLALRGAVDFYSGLLLVSAAACCIGLVSDLEVGSAREMGPAYFPLMVSLVMGAMGLFLMVRGALTKGPSVKGFKLRPLVLVTLSFVAFGALIAPAGLVVAIASQVAIAHFASSETRPIESVLLGIGLASFSAVTFVYLLGIPVNLLP